MTTNAQKGAATIVEVLGGAAEKIGAVLGGAEGAAAGRIAREVLGVVGQALRGGVTPDELMREVSRMIRAPRVDVRAAEAELDRRAAAKDRGEG